MNEQIPPVYDHIRVIDDKGFVGDMSSTVGVQLARSRSTDLILFKASADPLPLCRLVPIETYREEVRTKARKIVSKEERQQKTLEGQYSFDPGLKVKMVRISGVAAEQDYERKVRQCRDFLKKGHRLEIELLRGKRGTAQQAIERTQRICSELKDLAKPVNLPIRASRFENPRTILQFWPATPDQLKNFRLPSVIADSPAMMPKQPATSISREQIKPVDPKVKPGGAIRAEVVHKSRVGEE